METHIPQPQRTGLFIEADYESAILDERTVTLSNPIGKKVPVLTPIAHNSEVNTVFFHDPENSYFFDPSELGANTELTPLVGRIALLDNGSEIMVEQVGEDATSSELLEIITRKAGKKLVLDETVLDEFNGTVAAVHHFYSGINFSDRPETTFNTLRDAYSWLEKTGQWSAYEQMGIGYVNGADITPELMDQLWEVYDKTFDVLVSNHPSAQKQPKEDFFHQCQLPGSNITYAIYNGEVCSALFLVDDVADCYWLDSSYFKSVNPDGTTVFVPGISTKIDKQGMSLSPKIIDAMANITRLVPVMTGFATQCTNRSAAYIPDIAEKSTVGTANLDFVETAKYTYPVYKILTDDE